MSGKQTVIARDKAAAQMARNLLSSQLMLPIRFGSTIIMPGTVDKTKKIWILGDDGRKQVYYIRKNVLKVLDRDTFRQAHFNAQVAAIVYQRTAWIIPATKTFVGFSAGVLCGALAIPSLIGGIVYTAARTTALINLHPREVKIILKQLPVVFKQIAWFRVNCPILSIKMLMVVDRGIWAAIKTAPSNVTAADVADFVGRAIGGSYACALGKAPGATLTMLRHIIVRPLLAAGLHLTGAAVRGSTKERAKVSAAIRAEIEAQKVNLTPSESAEIDRELRTVAGALQRLVVLQMALKQVDLPLAKMAKSFSNMRQ